MWYRKHLSECQLPFFADRGPINEQPQLSTTPINIYRQKKAIYIRLNFIDPTLALRRIDFVDLITI